MNRYLKAFLIEVMVPLVIAVTVIGATLFIFGTKAKTTHYKSAMAVRMDTNVKLVSPCVPTDMTATIKEDTVILSFPTDKLSGKPVKVADQGIIIVEEESGQRFGISKALIPNTLPTRDNELFVLIEPGMLIIFEQKEGCKGIEAYLEAQSKLHR